jgi:HEAT repeat protein
MQQLHNFQLFRLQRQQREIQEDKTAFDMLEKQEQQLVALLLQQSSVKLFIDKITKEKPDVLQKQLQSKDSLARLLVITMIGQRKIHLEVEIIQSLNDPLPEIRQAAHNALVRISRGTDFGPVPGASRRGVERAVEKWRHWLELQKSASPEVLAKNAAKAAGKPVKAEPIDIVPLILEPAERRAPKESPNELLNAKGEAQLALLARLRDGADDDNTVVLALAIPKLNGDVRHEARDALTHRLARLSASALRDKLQDDDLEVRRAAALACGRKLAKDLIGDLITLLNDPEMDAVQSARAALTELTGEDFGPTRDAVHRERDEAVAAWRKWWKQQDKRP